MEACSGRENLQCQPSRDTAKPERFPPRALWFKTLPSPCTGADDSAGHGANVRVSCRTVFGREREYRTGMQLIPIASAGPEVHMSILNRIVAFLGNPSTQRPDTEDDRYTGDHFSYRPDKEASLEPPEFSRHPQELVQDARVPHRRRTAEEDY